MLDRPIESDKRASQCGRGAIQFVGGDLRYLRAHVRRYCVTCADKASASLSPPGSDRLVHQETKRAREAVRADCDGSTLNRDASLRPGAARSARVYWSSTARNVASALRRAVLRVQAPP